MDLSARAFALYRKLTTLFSAEKYHRTGESSIAQNGEGDVYDQSPYGLEDQMVSHSFRALRHSVIEWIGVQAFVLLYSRFVGTDGSSGLRICTREPVRLTDVVETSYPGTQGWYGLQRIFPLEFFLGGLTGIADRFGLRRTTDESK